MATLVERFARHLEDARLLARPGRAVVAVSGGPDSVALLDLLSSVASRRGIELIVAHADHGIQTESGSVAEWVRRLADRYGWPFALGELRLGSDVSETKARRARYAWLREVQAGHTARFLVTAHHRDDQLETIMLRVLRGSAPAGLAGMRARGPRGLVRPLLPFERAELAAHVAALGLMAHDDPANADPRHLRSWVRTRLLPLLVERLGPRVTGDVLRLGRYAARERRAWDRVLDVVPDLDLRLGAEGFDVARPVLAGYDKMLSVAILRAAARRAGWEISPGRAARLLPLAQGPSGRRVELGEGWVGEAAFDRLRVHRSRVTSAAPTVVHDQRGTVAFDTFQVSWEPSVAPGRLERRAWTTWVARPGWELRARRAGDRIRPLGGVGSRHVRRLLIEARVPRSQRAGYPVLARDETILWVPGICRGEGEVPTPGTPAVRVDVTSDGRVARAREAAASPGRVRGVGDTRSRGAVGS